MLNANGPGFAGLYAGDVVEFRTGAIGTAREDLRLVAVRRAGVLPLLVFTNHVCVRYGSCGYPVNASNFIRLVRRGKRHMAADKALAERRGHTCDLYDSSTSCLQCEADGEI
jgi:hypothetical protein